MLPPPGRPKVPGPPLPAVVATKKKGKPSQGALLPQQRQVSLSEVAAFQTIEAEMGGRGKLVAILSSTQLPKAVEQVLGMIADPRYDHENLAQICALGNVSLHQLMKAFQEAAKTRGQLLALTRIADRIPDVAAAVMDAAIPGLQTCDRCLGARVVSKPTNDDPDAVSECPNCKGTGTILFKPDHEVQKTALKISGLLDAGKGGGVNLTLLQQQLNSPKAETEGYDALMEGLDNLLYGKGRERLTRERTEEEPIEGEAEEVVEEVPPDPPLESADRISNTPGNPDDVGF